MGRSILAEAPACGYGPDTHEAPIPAPIPAPGIAATASGATGPGATGPEAAVAAESDLSRARAVCWRRQRAAAAAAWAAQRRYATAADRHGEIVAGRPAWTGVRPPPSRWRRVTRTVVAVGLLAGLLTVGLLGTLALLPVPFVVGPPAAALLVVARSVRRGRAAEAHPAVEDLVEAALEMRRAQAAMLGAEERAGAADRLAGHLRVTSAGLRAGHAPTRTGRGRRRVPGYAAAVCTAVARPAERATA